MPTGSGHWSRESIRAQRTVVAEHRSRLIALYQQRLIDAEVRDSRQALLRVARQRTRIPTLGFLDADFLEVADAPTVQRAIIETAVGVAGAAAADLQVYDPVGDDLRIVEHRGLSQEFLSFFASVDRSTPTACATAWRTGLPVIVDRVPASAIFAGQSTLDPMMDAGSRAVASYPLAGAGAAVGVLSLHYAKPPAERASAGLVVLGAAFSLSALNRP